VTAYSDAADLRKLKRKLAKRHPAKSRNQIAHKADQALHPEDYHPNGMRKANNDGPAEKWDPKRDGIF
jgi:hypothetical protein